MRLREVSRGNPFFNYETNPLFGGIPFEGSATDARPPIPVPCETRNAGRFGSLADGLPSVAVTVRLTDRRLAGRLPQGTDGIRGSVDRAANWQATLWQVVGGLQRISDQSRLQPNKDLVTVCLPAVDDGQPDQR